MERCKMCNGYKTISVMGGITKQCTECKGTGYILSSSISTETLSDTLEKIEAELTKDDTNIKNIELKKMKPSKRKLIKEILKKEPKKTKVILSID